MSELIKNESTSSESIQLNESEMFAQRRAKLDKWKELDIAPYGEAFETDGNIADVRAKFTEGLEIDVRVAGRITAIRDMGKSSFMDIRDFSGKIQVYIQKNVVGDELYSQFKLLDIGDFAGISGRLFLTKKGELSIKANKFKILSKALRFLPEKWHGLADIEQRYRQRYLDLITNENSVQIFRKRIEIIRYIRNFLTDRGFLEVETPMLQPIPGGALAKPFETFYHALNSKMYMRIAPELYLKRLLVGGFNKIFELNRNFRNEGMSRKHNPEFTMIEIYQAYGDCKTMMILVEDLISSLAENINGSKILQKKDGTTIDLTTPWKRVEYDELIKVYAGEDWFSLDKNAKIAKAKSFGIPISEAMTDGEITHEVYEKCVEPQLIQPTFVTKLPIELVPLAKHCKDDPSKVDVFELEINGQEISPGYSELNDPIEQKERFLKQHGENQDAGKMDEDFLCALEHGMPPAGGMGIGIDRLVMLITGAESIRDVILFPQLRPKS
ncbi:MAG TPA: lysine--tRNA ligase [Victivallales bacterium]|nr:lysine--tRNA ligase [Victivallales bacterium]HPO90174.1 lysine--tRNA ligase [Victivallales bacterium]HRR06061.1 lysine--tRNA ligase [Victivallales bacterium]HRU00073.1 lysine--tRNA ligase [Victivallales bacterium]